MTGTLIALLVWAIALAYIWRTLTAGRCPECEGYGIVDFGSDPARTCDRCKGSGKWEPIPELRTQSDTSQGGRMLYDDSGRSWWKESDGRMVCGICFGKGQLVDGKDGYKPVLCPECWRDGHA